MKLSSNPPPHNNPLYKGGGDGSNKSLRNNLFCKLMYSGGKIYAKISVYNLKMQKFTKGLVQITDLLEPPPLYNGLWGGRGVVPRNPLEITLFAN